MAADVTAPNAASTGTRPIWKGDLKGLSIPAFFSLSHIRARLTKRYTMNIADTAICATAEILPRDMSNRAVVRNAARITAVHGVPVAE